MTFKRKRQRHGTPGGTAEARVCRVRSDFDPLKHLAGPSGGEGWAPRGAFFSLSLCRGHVEWLL